MKLFLSINGHANRESLPLRFGLQIEKKHQCFVSLENYSYDDYGTKCQRQNEIEAGNKHYIGELNIPNKDTSLMPHIIDCRLVLSSPSSSELPKIITVLAKDSNHGDLTVTKHISGMLKRGRITHDELIEFFHPAYRAGLIKDSNDCEEIYQQIRTNNPQSISTLTKVDEIILESAGEIKSAIESFDSENIALEDKLSFKELALNPFVKYQYVMADAYIQDVWRDEDKIWIKVINSKGDLQDLHSFKIREHLSAHHDYTYDYLESRKGQRAHFAICISEPCKGFLAESVTSISLQLMKTSV